MSLIKILFSPSFLFLSIRDPFLIPLFLYLRFFIFISWFLFRSALIVPISGKFLSRAHFSSEVTSASQFRPHETINVDCDEWRLYKNGYEGVYLDFCLDEAFQRERRESEMDLESIEIERKEKRES